jgi:hypothetical protein
MKLRKNRKKSDHSVSIFDSFLEEAGIKDEVEAVAIKRVLAWQLERAEGSAEDEAGYGEGAADEPVTAGSLT